MPEHYYLIRRYNSRFVVDVGGDSPAPVDRFSRWFDTFEEAVQYAAADESQYRISLGEGMDDFGGDLPDAV